MTITDDPLNITERLKQNKTIVILNASALKESSCLLRTYWTVFSGYKPKINNNDIEFGSAFHKFRASFRSGNKIQDAYGSATKYFAETPMLVKNNKKYLTQMFLKTVCTGYIAKYLGNDDWNTVKVDLDGVTHPLIEMPFGFEYYVDDYIEVLMGGTIDEIAKKQNGIYAIMDCKTTSMWDIPGYFRQYELSPQMLFYRWAIRQYAKKYPDSFYEEIDRKGCGVIIDGVFFKGEDVSKIEYSRNFPFMFTDYDLAEFEQLINEKVHSLIPYIKSQIPPMREGILNGACQTPYGECKFFNVCAAPDRETGQILLNKQFKKQFYNPIELYE